MQIEETLQFDIVNKKQKPWDSTRAFAFGIIG